MGNRLSLSYPNGNVTDYAYDSRNRLAELTTTGASGNVLQRYTYTLHPTGRRTRIEEASGRITYYEYDDLYRLTAETITDSQNGGYDATYLYDPVGNRLQGIIDGVTTAYTYDANDRLLQQGGTTYTYDANGNTLTETVGGQATAYDYDSRDRLMGVTNGTDNVEFAYDADGIRTARAENGVATRYLVDQNRDYAQVLTEIADSAIEVDYLYGDDLIVQDRSGDRRYHLYDGLGSTRGLSDPAGAMTDGYHYDAFGNELERTGTSENNYLFTREQFDESLGQYYLSTSVLLCHDLDSQVSSRGRSRNSLGLYIPHPLIESRFGDKVT